MALQRLSVHFAAAGALAWNNWHKQNCSIQLVVIIHVSGNHKIRNHKIQNFLKSRFKVFEAHRGVHRLTCVSRVLIGHSETLITLDKLYGAIRLVFPIYLFIWMLQCCFDMTLQKHCVDNESFLLLIFIFTPSPDIIVRSFSAADFVKCSCFLSCHRQFESKQLPPLFCPCLCYIMSSEAPIVSLFIYWNSKRCASSATRNLL